jgi:hypothetical protein
LKFSQSYDDFAIVDTDLGPFRVSNTLSNADDDAGADVADAVNDAEPEEALSAEPSGFTVRSTLQR